MGPQHSWLDPARELEETPRLPAAHSVMFDTSRLDRRDERLWRNQEVVPLPPKTFAVLCCLVKQAGQLVAKDALLEAVWPETVVSESVLQVAVRQLRQVLVDQVRTPRFIETVHGRGYRFIAPVRTLVSPDCSVVMGALRSAPSPRFRRPRHFVGREAALTQVMQWWIAARQGTRQVGVIAGEPGIGKTALVDAFLAQVATGGDCRVGHGQCIELILGTYRPVDAIVQPHPLRTVLTELQQHGQCVELALDYLSDVEVTAYLRQRFGDPGVVADLARVLHERTHGNPLFLIAVVDELVPSAGGERGTRRVGYAGSGGDHLHDCPSDAPGAH